MLSKLVLTTQGKQIQIGSGYSNVANTGRNILTSLSPTIVQDEWH